MKGKITFLATSLLLVLLVSCFGQCIAGAATATVNFPSYLWGEIGQTVDFLKSVVKEFETANPGAKVNGYDVPYVGYFDKMMVELSAGTPGDLLTPLDTYVGTWAEAGLLEPLDKWLKKTDIPSTFLDLQQQEPLVLNGQTYGVGWITVNYPVVYHSQMYKDVGFSEFPKTVDELFTAWQKLTKDTTGDGKTDQWAYGCVLVPGNPVELYMDTIHWVLGAGGSFVKDGKPNALDPKTIQGVKWFKQVYDSKWSPEGMSKSTYRTMWIEGKVATLFDVMWMPQWIQTENPKLAPYVKTCAKPFPYKRASTIQIDWVVPKGSKNKDLAWKLLEEFCSQKSQTATLTWKGGQPFRKGCVPKDWLAKNPWYQAYMAEAEQFAVPWITPLGNWANTDAAVKAVSKHVEAVLFMNMPVEKAMAALQQELQDIMTRAK